MTTRQLYDTLLWITGLYDIQRDDKKDERHIAAVFDLTVNPHSDIADDSIGLFCLEENGENLPGMPYSITCIEKISTVTKLTAEDKGTF